MNLTEETTDSTRAPGLAAMVRTLVLLVTYVGVGTAVVAYAGIGRSRSSTTTKHLRRARRRGARDAWDKIVVLAIVISAISSTQTTIIPASRTTFSMGRADALPAVRGRPPPLPHARVLDDRRRRARHRLVRAGELHLRELPLRHALGSSLMIAFYYALSGVACACTTGASCSSPSKNFLFIGVAPLVGAGILFYLFAKSCIDLADPENSYTGQTWLGVGPPLVIGVGFLLLGVVLLVALAARRPRAFFGRSRSRPSTRVAGRVNRDRRGDLQWPTSSSATTTPSPRTPSRRAVELAARSATESSSRTGTAPPERRRGVRGARALRELGEPDDAGGRACAARPGSELERRSCRSARGGADRARGGAGGSHDRRGHRGERPLSASARLRAAQAPAPLAGTRARVVPMPRLMNSHCGARRAARERREAFRRHGGSGRRVGGRPARLVLPAPRPLGLRQDDDPADDRRVRGSLRPDGSSSATRTSPICRPSSARREHRLPEHALFPHLTVFRAKHRIRTPSPQDADERGIRHQVRFLNMLDLVELICPGDQERKPRASSRAASSSALRSHALW